MQADQKGSKKRKKYNDEKFEELSKDLEESSGA
jgi:hypothetical protein